MQATLMRFLPVRDPVSPHCTARPVNRHRSRSRPRRDGRARVAPSRARL